MEEKIISVLYSLTLFFGYYIILNLGESSLRKMHSEPGIGRPVTQFNLKKKWFSISSINHFNDWLQMLLVNWGLFGIVLLFPLMRPIQVGSLEWSSNMVFPQKAIFELFFYLFVIDYVFLIINSRESRKINQFLFLSILDFSIIYFIIKSEGILSVNEIISVQSELSQIWLVKYHVIIVGLIAVKLIKLLMLNEAYYFSPARNLRFLIEASVISVFMAGQLLDVHSSQIEFIPVFDLFQHGLRILGISIFMRLLFNHVPRRTHVQI